MDATGFPNLCEKCFFPLKRRRNDVTRERHLPQKMRCCLPDATMPSLTFYLNPLRRYICLQVFWPLYWPARAVKGKCLVRGVSLSKHLT